MTDDHAKRLAQLKQAFESGIIDKDTYRAAVAALGGDTIANQALADGASSIAQSGGVAAHNIAVGKDVNGNVININVNAANLDPERLWRLVGKPLPSPDLKRVTAQFLQTLVDRYRYLDFRGMGVSDRIPLRLALLEMYVPLKARAQMPEGETWARELRLAGRPPSEAETEAMGQRLSEPQSVLDLLTKHDGLIILGDPGSGKTTFLKFLALTLATGQGEALGLSTRLPVLLPLSAYASALATGDIPLDRFISAYFQDRGIDLPVEAMLDEALAQGGTLLLLDGLDEVKEVGQRHLVVDRVTDFYSFHRRTGNKFVLTSRLVGYPEVRPRVEGLAECTLVDLEDEDIEDFIDKWTAALEKAAQGTTQVAVFEAKRERDELVNAVHQNPGVRSLAANPLLLTILALMKRQGVELPERRVELYQAYVETLLKHWNLARSLAGRAAARDLDVVETLRILAPLALWIHRSSPGVGLVKEGDLRLELESIFNERGHEDAEREAREFLDDLRSISSLLIDRGGRQYGFIHLTFEEYLAGVALAQKGQRDIEPIVDELAAHVDDDTWREVSLLTVGFLGIVQQRDEAAAAVVEGLIERAPGELGQAVLLAGEAVADAGAGGVTPRCRSKVTETLLQTLRDDHHIKPNLRAECGRILAGVGDPRPEVMTLDAMHFCYIPAGPFLMGSTDDDEMAYDNEKRQHEVTIAYDYWIARYPVTVAQYQAYIEAIGKDPRDAYSLRGPSNHPVVNVDWHEATAFCGWLTEHWRQQGILEPGMAVRLPSEPEWEKAARGGIQTPTSPHVGGFSDIKVPDLSKNPNAGRRYPWGDDPDPNRANYRDSEIRATNTVGSFSGGASLYGCEEMSGNVLEWTRSLWGKELEKPEFAYPYDPTDGRENLNAPSDVRRVLRGGSFGHYRDYVRCAYRYWSFPGYGGYFIGFRVVVSPFVSGR